MQLIALTDRSGLDYLRDVVDRARDMRPVLHEIGEDMTESTKRRFATATGPDGQPWAPNSPVTLANYGARFKAGKSRDARVAGKKPLTGETKALQTTINYQLPDSTSVAIGSPMVYAAAQQYGMKSGEAGFGLFETREGSFPIPWGDIPARPFLGASDDDRANITDLVTSYLRGE